MKFRKILFLLLIICFAFKAEGRSTISLGDPQKLVDVKSIIPDIMLDIRYATENNFLKKAVYPKAMAYLREPTAHRLKMVADDLRAQGYRIRLYDGYRPLSVQKWMWKMMPDARYVANPAHGSVHNRGGAVDLSMVTLEGKDVEMPTGYDDFSIKAHHDYEGASSEAKKNVKILKEAMEKAGFTSIRTEWWHYNDPLAKKWPVLDIEFEKIEPDEKITLPLPNFLNH